MKDGSRVEYEEPEILPDPSWVLDPLMLMLYEEAQKHKGDVVGFLQALQYWGVYSEKMRDFLAWILGNLFGFSGKKDENGNWYLHNGAGDKIEIIATDNGQFDDVTITIDPADPTATHWKIKFVASVTEYEDHYIIIVYKSVYQNGELFYVTKETWNVGGNGQWELIASETTYY
jgi:hypothetical protein